MILGPSVSRDDVITQFSHYESWPQSRVLFLGACLGRVGAGLAG